MKRLHGWMLIVRAGNQYLNQTQVPHCKQENFSVLKCASSQLLVMRSFLMVNMSLLSIGTLLSSLHRARHEIRFNSPRAFKGARLELLGPLVWPIRPLWDYISRFTAAVRSNRLWHWYSSLLRGDYGCRQNKVARKKADYLNGDISCEMRPRSRSACCKWRRKVLHFKSEYPCSSFIKWICFWEDTLFGNNLNCQNLSESGFWKMSKLAEPLAVQCHTKKISILNWGGFLLFVKPALNATMFIGCAVLSTHSPTFHMCFFKLLLKANYIK